jgi:hypothetical protein
MVFLYHPKMIILSSIYKMIRALYLRMNLFPGFGITREIALGAVQKLRGQDFNHF